jgi:peptidoglycan/LPS O-acetylase OafA/YrhL
VESVGRKLEALPRDRQDLPRQNLPRQDVPRQDFASENIPQLTGLRGVAASMVLLLHLDQIHGNILAPFVAPVAQGYLGVDIFFVLSGFILAHVYRDTAVHSLRGYGVFLWRRFARIYPMHLATLAALIAMVAARGLLDTNFWTVSEIPRHLLLLQAWVPELTWNLPSWSISAEWAAYVLFPLAVATILRPRRMIVPLLVVVILLGCFQVFGIDRSGLPGSWMGWPAAFRIASEFSLGVLAFRLSRSAGTSGRSDLVAAAAFCLLFIVPVGVVKILAIGIFVAALATSSGPVRQLLASRAFVALGIISYSIYMVHFPAIKLIQNVNDKLGIESASPALALLMMFVWTGTVIAIAAAGYHAIERPARNWCRRQEARLFQPLPIAALRKS